MKIKLDPGAYIPERAHATDAGLDLRSPITAIVPGHGAETIRTGVHVQLPKNTAGLIVSKSGLNVKYDLTSTGLIDEGYSGEIVIRLHNHSDQAYLVSKGDKVSQLVVIPVLYEQVEVVDELEETERGENGFGSTGR